MGVALLLIDAQVDFCDPSGALYVQGAEEDMARVAEWIQREQSRIDTIVVTLDSHHLMDIAHPGWWIDAYGGNPTPFTAITLDDLKKSRYNVANDATREASLAYVEHLAEEGKKTLVIWPPHCLLGHPGHALFPAIRDAVDAWELAKCKPVEYVLKGTNPYTEHYSAVQAEKIDPNDPSTAPNGAMIHLLDEHDRIVVAGEALSHCVADTVSDLMEQIDRSKFVLLEDGMSCVPSFENLGGRFLFRAKGRGATITETDRFSL
jgi:nicotinamidase-related amidase